MAAVHDSVQKNKRHGSCLNKLAKGLVLQDAERSWKSVGVGAEHLAGVSPKLGPNPEMRSV